MNGERAIVVVSFGTTYVESLNTCIVPIEKAVAEAFLSHKVERAFTSAFVRGRLAEQGIITGSLPEVLDRLCEEGCRDVVIMVTHVMAGEEYMNKVVLAAEAYRGRFAYLAISRPLLVQADITDCAAKYAEIVQAMRAQFPPLGTGDVVVLMGHGSRGADNSVYPCLQASFDAVSEPVIIGVLEECESLTLDGVMQRLAAMKVTGTVHLMPLLVVAGRHAAKDMLVWQTRMQEAGYRVVMHERGLGENEAIRALYIERIREVIAETI